MKKGFLLLATGLLATTLSAIPVDVDAGNDGWTGWSRDPGVNTTDNGTFLGTSNTIDTGAGNQAWGLYAKNSQTSSATYAFGGTLAVGDTVSIDVSIGWINSGGTVGFGLQNSSNTNRFEAYYIGGDTSDSWKINDADGPDNILGPVTTFAESTWQNGNLNSLTFLYTQKAGNSFDLSVNGTPIINSNRNLNASDISQIRLFNFNAGDGSNHDQFFNNLEVVPEPGMSLLFLSGLGLIVYLRRRK